ncbi:MAG: deoxyribonuclease IV [Chloroflexi bacterium]|nr:deoxyribonuclease IV [Chloroflexota bacterium]
MADRSKPPRIGAHVAGGIGKGIERALEIGAECIQIFASPPQAWRRPSHDDRSVETFLDGCRQHGIGPVFLHGIYLVNLGAANADTYGKSVEATREHLRWANRLGAGGLIIHLGSAGTAPYEEAEDRVVDALARILSEDDGSAPILLENCAGQGQTIGRSFTELGRVVDRLDRHPRLGLCLDTAHVFAAGYDITGAAGLAAVIEEIEQAVGLDRLRCIHANDSKSRLASNVDRHENIGFGQIGEAAFARLLHHPVLRPLPWILEVPGIDGGGPDRANVEMLRRLAGLPALAEPDVGTRRSS